MATGEHMTPAYLELNPMHTVPTMDDDGFVMIESRAIMTYLADSQSPDNPLYPSDPKLRGAIDERLYFDSSIFSPRITAIFGPVIFRGATTIPEENRKKVYEGFNKLETFLEKNAWVAGDDMSLADLSILAILSSAVEAGADISGHTKISEWYEKIQSIPGYEENMAGAQMIGGLVKSKLQEPF